MAPTHVIKCCGLGRPSATTLKSAACNKPSLPEYNGFCCLEHRNTVNEHAADSVVIYQGLIAKAIQSPAYARRLEHFRGIVQDIVFQSIQSQVVEQTNELENALLKQYEEKIQHVKKIAKGESVVGTKRKGKQLKERASKMQIALFCDGSPDPDTPTDSPHVVVVSANKPVAVPVATRPMHQVVDLIQKAQNEEEELLEYDEEDTDIGVDKEYLDEIEAGGMQE